MVGRAAFLLAVAAYHYVVAWGIVYHPSVVAVTSLHKFAHLDGIVLILAGASTLSAVALVMEHYASHPFTRWLFLACHVPQQFLLVITAIGAYAVTAAGAYPDGYVPSGDPHWFIGIDQAPYGLIAVAHLFIMLNGHIPYRRIWRRIRG